MSENWECAFWHKCELNIRFPTPYTLLEFFEPLSHILINRFIRHLGLAPLRRPRLWLFFASVKSNSISIRSVDHAVRWIPLIICHWYGFLGNVLNEGTRLWVVPEVEHGMIDANPSFPLNRYRLQIERRPVVHQMAANKISDQPLMARQYSSELRHGDKWLIFERK